jgi:hypothetical protein
MRARDLWDAEKALNFDPVIGSWVLEGNAEDFRRSEQRDAILTALTHAAPRSLTANDVRSRLDSSPGYAAVRQTLSRMAKDGQVIRTGKGYYAVLRKEERLPIEEQLQQSHSYKSQVSQLSQGHRGSPSPRGRL